MTVKFNEAHVSVAGFECVPVDWKRIARRVLNALVVVVVCYVLPLTGNFVLLFEPRVLVTIGACLVMILTQPEITLAAAKRNERSDHYSVLLILVCAIMCQVMAVLEWRHFRDGAFPAAYMIGESIGIVLLIGGVAFRVAAIRALRSSFTATVQVVEGQRLITNGLYGKLRHPSYLGAYAAYIGGALLLHAYVSALAVAVVMFLVYRFRIAVEEEALIRSFGERYLRYRLSTSRMIPYVY